MAARWRRFRTLFGLDPGRDVDDEIAFHLEMRIQELVDRGEPPARARDLALRRFGDYEASRLECVAIDARRRRGLMRMEFFADRLQDTRYALRMFRRAPAFTAVAVLMLALGMGANAAVFSIFQRLLLRPLPVSEPEQLVNLWAPGLKSGSISCGIVGECDAVFSYPTFRDLERSQAGLATLAAHRDFEANLGFRGETVSGSGFLVSGSYFPVLRLRPSLGRLLGPDDDRTIGGAEVVVLSHEYWQRQRGGRAGVLGETIVVNGVGLTVVGVAPPGFEGTTRGLTPQVFVPITMRWRMLPSPNNAPDNRRAYWVYAFARLEPGVPLEQAQTALDTRYRAIVNDVEAPLQQGLSQQAMARFRDKRLRLTPGSRGQSTLFGDAGAPLTLLLGVTGLMLVITCMNVANLLLARAASRSREMATRLSIGASRGRLVAQVLTEASVLGLAAALASLLVSKWTLAMVRLLLPGDFVAGLELDHLAPAATALLALGATLAIGLVPAIHAARPQGLAALKSQPGQPAGARAASRFRIGLAMAQVGLSTVLVVLAGLFAKSLANISHANPGLDPAGLVTFGVSPLRNGYTPARAEALFDRLQDELATLPNVVSASSSTTTLFSNDQRVTQAFAEGFDAAPDADSSTGYDEIADGYFRTLGTAVIAGREFTRADSAGGPKVAMVNEDFARKFHLGPDVVGKRISARTPALDLEIVGLVRSGRYSGFHERAEPMYFVPHRQNTRRPGLMTFYVRTSARTEDLMAGIRQLVRRLDQNLPVETMRTMHEAMRGATERERLLGVMTTAFAALALLVAAVGLYGVLAFTVAQRTPEIGLRMALGATRGGVRLMVLRQTAWIAAAGGTLGLVAAIVIGRAARSLLFGLEFHDPAVLVAASSVLLLVIGAAGFLPADRAARIDPMRALRCE